MTKNDSTDRHFNDEMKLFHSGKETCQQMKYWNCLCVSCWRDSRLISWTRWECLKNFLVSSQFYYSNQSNIFFFNNKTKTKKSNEYSSMKKKIDVALICRCKYRMKRTSSIRCLHIVLSPSFSFLSLSLWIFASRCSTQMIDQSDSSSPITTKEEKLNSYKIGILLIKQRSIRFNKGQNPTVDHWSKILWHNYANVVLEQVHFGYCLLNHLFARRQLNINLWFDKASFGMKCCGLKIITNPQLFLDRQADEMQKCWVYNLLFLDSL